MNLKVFSFLAYALVATILCAPGLQFSAQARDESWSEFFRDSLRKTESRFLPKVEGAEKLKEIESTFLNRQKRYLKTEAVDDKSQRLMGGIDSGGGTLFVKGNKMILLDFRNFPFRAANQEGHIIDRNTNCRVETFRIHNLPFADYMSDLTGPLSESMSDQKIQAFEKALYNLQLMFVDKAFTTEALDPKAYAKNSDKPFLVPLAMYIKGQGVLVSLPLFNKLALRDQLGLIIHETLRQVSIGYELAISDQDLQKLTSAIMSKKTASLLKKEKKSFERADLHPELFDGILTSYSLRADLNYFCSYSKGQGNPLGQGCLSLATTQTDDIYKVLPLVRDEALKYYASDDITNSDKRNSWNNILKRMSSFRQSRLFAMNTYPSLMSRAFSKGPLQRQEPQERAEMCAGFIKALKEENLIKD